MTITQLINEPAGATMQLPVNQAITENNSVLSGCGVHFLFRGSRVNLETGKNGIRWLITEILTEAQAIFPLYAGAYRNLYLSYGLTTEEIIAKVRSVNGFDKYPNHTIEQYLSIIMTKDKQVSRIQMTGKEDRPRDCKRPRCKWYLIAAPKAE
jgi:hypothetical protein